MAKKPPLYPHKTPSQIKGEEQESKPETVEIKRYHGRIAQVGEATVKAVMLPDFDLVYFAFPEGQMAKYRATLLKEHTPIVKVTKERIYFTQD